ncbi:MAG: hypothetical protein JXJ04_04335 [Spirochaetales bacterium]|nr:hypothetical protein [Spirochaetales bacterium]
MLVKNKNIRIILIIIVLTICSLIQLQAQILGDVDRDNTISIVDALLVAQYYVDLNPATFYASEADVDCNGGIDIVDALLIAQNYVGLIGAFTCGSTQVPTSAPTTVVSTPDPTAVSTPAPTQLPDETPVTGEPVSCAGYPGWNSGTIYSEGGQYVQYNCNLYRNNYFSFDQNPEENSTSEYDTWVLIGPCNDDCFMGEGPWTACGEWDNWENGDYILYNNIWGGDAAGTQCIWANSYSNWGVTADHPNTGGVKSYPNSSKDINRTVSSIGSLRSSFNVTVPSSGSYATTYDIWANSHQYEIMIWMNYTGAVGPIAKAWNDDGDPIPEATNQSVGGHTWNVYKGNIGFTVISFVRTSNTNSGTVDIKAILTFIQNQGWFGDVTIQEAQFGFEITSSAGGLDFTCNSYSID